MFSNSAARLYFSTRSPDDVFRDGSDVEVLETPVNGEDWTDEKEAADDDDDDEDDDDDDGGGGNDSSENEKIKF